MLNPLMYALAFYLLNSLFSPRHVCCDNQREDTTPIPEMLGRFLNLNKITIKRL